jgi:tetratricopeptide (TPR) repeat protein
MKGAIRALLPAVLVLVVSVPAAADDIEAARRHYTQGSKDFDLGLYDKAIEEYMAAYDAKPDPALLYNIAQAHKLAGHPEQAVRFYRTYLSRVPDAPNGDEVRAKIAELQKAIDQQQKARSMPPDHVQPLDSAPATAPIATPAPAPVASPSEPEPAPALPASDTGRARTLKVTGISVAAVGLAALGAGIGLAVVAKQDSNQLSTTDQQHGVFDPSKDSTGRAFGVAGPALIGVGAAAVVIGGVVFVLGHRAEHRAPAAVAVAR